MPVDTSMYAQQPQQANPLQMLSGVAALQGQLQQNRLLATQMGARQAMGEDIQAATGPDGTFDADKFQATMAGDPRAAYAAEEGANFAQAQRQAQLTFAHQQYDKLNTAISSALSTGFDESGHYDPSRISPKAITSSVADLVKEGVISAKIGATELASMPANDPKALDGWLRNHLVKGMDAQAQIEAMMGTPHPVNTGAETQFVRTPAMGAAPAPFENTMSPGEAATPVPGPVTASGQPTMITKGQFAKTTAPIVTGLSPGQTAAQTTSGTGTAQDALAFENAARTVPDLRAALANMTGDLKQFESGPGSHGRAGFLAAVNSLFNGSIQAERVASQEGFDKLAAQVAARQRQLLGLSGTDQQMSMIAGASPGSQLSKLGNANQIAIIRGNNDALDAENRAWQTYKANGGGAESFHDFTTTFNKYVDPVVFQMQYMSADQKKALIGAMNEQQKQRLAESMAFARHNGLIK